MTLSQVNGGGKMENEDLRVKVAAPRVLLPTILDQVYVFW